MRRILILGMFLFALASHADAAPYYNSSEAGCDGSDSTVLLCEDFEDGSWYVTDCDTSGGRTNTDNDGWCGTIFANPITPTNAVVSGVTPFGTYAGTAGLKDGVGGTNDGMHYFKTSGCGTDASQRCGVQEVYVRWYTYFESGYQFGAEKHMNITNLDGDIAFANVQINCGFGASQSTGVLYVQVIHGEDACFTQNQGNNITLDSGKWYFFEMHLVAHATAGQIDLWVNDCGAAGTSCGASPVLRMSRTGLQLPGNSNGSAIETIWAESWANPASSGTGPYWDNIKVATAGPIGFSGDSGGSGNGYPQGTRRMAPMIHLKRGS